MLSLQIYTDPDGPLLADYTWRTGGAGGFSFGTNEHGFAALSISKLPMDLDESFRVYEWPGTPHVVVSDQAAGVVWEGRLEDIAIVPGGVSLLALGYQRALADVPYTALWSRTSTADWRPVTEQERTDAKPAQYEMDNNNRLYITPKKGETFAAGSASLGELTYALPHYTLRNAARFEADYSMRLPAGWTFRLIMCDYDFGNVHAHTAITATGSVQTGSWDILVVARQRLIVSVTNATGSPVTITDETGVNYARLTNIRIKSVTETTVTASAIVSSLAAYVNSINPLQLAADAGQIEATTTDLRDELYENQYPAAILERLAGLHNAEWGVWEQQLLHFRPRGSRGRHWYVDVTAILDLQRSLENVRNSAYGVYRTAAGRTQRTAVANDAASQARYGVVRRGFVNVQTTSAAEAQTHRDAWLADRATMQARARIEFDRLYDAAGAEAPMYALRAGDTVTMRNLPPTLSTAVDRIRTFVIGETSYDARANRIDIAPETPVPTLVTLVARREAGIA